MYEANTETRKDVFSPQRVLLIIGLLFGWIFIFVTPPFQAPDEFHHMFRAYQISMGGIISSKSEGISGAELPSSLGDTVLTVSKNVLQHPQYPQKLKEIEKTLRIPLAPEDVQFYYFPNTARYAPAMYVPQVVGIFAGRLFQCTPIVIMYLGRITNFIAWMLLMYIAVRTTPIYKWLFVLLALTPKSLFMGASLSADAFTNSIAFVYSAVVFKIAYGKAERVSNGELAVLFLTSAMLSLSKQVYAPLLLLLFMIPVSKFGNFKRYAALMCAIFAVNAVVALLWYFLMGGLNEPLRFDIAVSPVRQWHFITHHPVDFIVVMKTTLAAYWYDMIVEFIGNLGWLDTQLPPFIHITYWALLIFTGIVENRADVVISAKDKAAAFAAFVSITFLIALSQYLTWTTVSKPIIMGMTGRYFIPASAALFILFYNNRLHIDTQRPLFGTLILCYMAVIMVSTAAAMILRYYL
ncbi:MAG: DUF2142 domain-containing protein [Nitrospirae bacterium]|nr:DUF2142 domain-containing protein [Nitrospirota bacterium]